MGNLRERMNIPNHHGTKMVWGSVGAPFSVRLKGCLLAAKRAAPAVLGGTEAPSYSGKRGERISYVLHQLVEWLVEHRTSAINC